MGSPSDDLGGDGADFAQDGLGGGAGAAHQAFTFQDPLHQGLVEVEEGHGLELVSHAPQEGPGQAIPGDGAPAQAGDEGPHRLTGAIQGQAHVDGHDATDPDGEAFFDDDDPLDIAQGIARRRCR